MSRLFWKVSNGIFPEYRQMKRYIGAYVRLSPEAAAKQTRQSLYRYLNYCRTYSPYWRERWPTEAQDFLPEEVDDVLRLLPPLDKKDLREHQAALTILPEYRKAGDGFPALGRQKQVKTGGTTGVPVVVFQDDKNDHQIRATIDFYYELCGLAPGSPFFYVWGSNNELSELSKSLRKRVSSWLRGIHPIPAFSLTPEKLVSIAAQMREHDHVDSAMFFTSTLETFLSWAERNNTSLRRLKRVLTGGGLLHEELRRKAEQYLADEVFDVYGTRDFGLIACETPTHDGLKLASWLHHVEVLDPSGERTQPGSVGQVHVTTFWNYSFALIRAATGDTAQWHPPEPGEALPVPSLRELRGRVAEHLRGPNNAVIDPSAIIHMIGVLIAPPWLRKFQLRQLSTTGFELHVESWESQLSEQALEDFRASVAAGLTKLLSVPVQIAAVHVDAIPPTLSGKHLYCVQSSAASAAMTVSNPTAG